MSTGTIKTLVSDKGFGFIVADDQKPGDKDLFFHREALVGVNYEDLKVGDKVSYDVEASDRGPKAANVKKV